MPGRVSSDLRILALTLAAGAVLVAVVVLVLSPSQDDEHVPLRTTFSSNLEGSAAVYELYGRLGVPVTRVRTPLSSEALEPLAVLFVLNPLTAPRDDELAAIDRWVRAGGVLVTTATTLPEETLRWVLEPEGPTVSVPMAPPPEPLDDYGRRLPLAEGMEKVRLGTPWDVRNVAELEGQALFQDQHGVRVASRPWGQGQVLLLADSSFLANGLLGAADNMLLAANLVTHAMGHARAGAVGFDEYHLGEGASPGGSWALLGRLLVKSPPGWAVLVLTVAAAVYLFERGKQFGSRHGRAPAPRRARMQYVRAVAATFRARRANHLVLKLLFDQVRSQAVRAGALAADCSDEALARALAHRTGQPSIRYAQALAGCRRRLAQDVVSTKQLHAALELLAILEEGCRRPGRVVHQEVFHGP